VLKKRGKRRRNLGHLVTLLRKEGMGGSFNKRGFFIEKKEVIL
jgi:hypothetical protein